MAESGLRATIEQFYQAYVSGDFERMAAFIHKDIDWIIYAPIMVFPYAGHRRGRKAVVEALMAIARDYRLESYTREWLIADGDRLAMIADAGVVQTATGRSLRFRLADFMRFKDGQMIEFREFSNSFDVVEQALGRELPF